MIGTLLNAVAVLVGSSLGLLAGHRLSQEMQQAIVMGLGFVTLSVGLQNSFSTGNILIPLFSIALGVILGEALDIQGKLSAFGAWLQTRFASAQGEHFINGFVTASLVFCVGPLTILGSLQDGMSGDYELLAIKSALDFFASMAFAASLGGGVMFSIITILLVQGSIALLGAVGGNAMNEMMINEVTAVGGMLLTGLSLILMDLKHPRIANYLPALLIAPLIIAVAELLGVKLYPL